MRKKTENYRRRLHKKRKRVKRGFKERNLLRYLIAFP